MVFAFCYLSPNSRYDGYSDAATDIAFALSVLAPLATVPLSLKYSLTD